MSSILLDIRTPEEYCAGHLKGAILVPTAHPPLTSRQQDALEERLSNTLRHVPKSMPIFIYCKKGIRAKQAEQLVRSLGFRNVQSLGGATEEPLASLFRENIRICTCSFGTGSTHLNIEDLTNENTDFRHVIATPGKFQLVVMSLLPGEDIGMEKHDQVDQFIRVEEGHGLAIVQSGESKKKNFTVPLTPGDALIVKHGDWHNVINTDRSTPLKLYTIYSPPNHRHGLVQREKVLD